MSRVSEAITLPDTAPPPPQASRPVISDVVVTVAWFVGAGVVGALAWWLLTPLPQVTKTADGAVYDNDALTSRVAIDGWFCLVALVGGLVSGIVLLAWRGRRPVLMVLLVVLGAALASWLMTRLGLVLGPEEETAALRGLPQGGKVPMQLELHATGVAWLWPMAAALGALVHLWVWQRPADRES